MIKSKRIKFVILALSAIAAILAVVFIVGKNVPDKTKSVPHEKRWGIYELALNNNKTNLIYSSDDKISEIKLNHQGDKIAFSGTSGGDADTNYEIFTIAANGGDLKKFTDNNFLDVYPAWSAEDSHIAFLSKRAKDLDIYVMNSDGSNVKKLYDSGSNDADIDWVKNKIVFTRNSQIWIMDDNGENPKQVTNPPRAGEWGKANLPFGDYDPRLSPDGTKIVFERLEKDESANGNYNLFTINSDGTNEMRLTNNGYSQGLPNWSHTGEKIVYIVAAIGSEGKYDIYTMDSDGTNSHNVTPIYFPSNFLVHSSVFSADDSKIFFVGEWWE